MWVCVYVYMYKYTNAYICICIFISPPPLASPRRPPLSSLSPAIPTWLSLSLSLPLPLSPSPSPSCCLSLRRWVGDCVYYDCADVRVRET